MTRNINKLLAIAGPALGPNVTMEECCEAGVPDDLALLLVRQNGFFALEAALHVFPLGAEGEAETDLMRWNEDELWRHAYRGFVDEGDIFFAEDVFGGQFLLRNDSVFSFDPETGGAERIAGTIDQWAGCILADFEVLTGQSLAHEWQARHGRIPRGWRLVPKIPFVMGGEFAVENMRPLEAVESMLFRGDIATQIRDLPDGSQIELKVVK